MKTFACCSGVNMLGNLWAAMFSAGSFSVILLLFVFVFLRDLDRLPAKGYLPALSAGPLTLRSLWSSHNRVIRNCMYTSYAPTKCCCLITSAATAVEDCLLLAQLHWQAMLSHGGNRRDAVVDVRQRLCRCCGCSARSASEFEDSRKLSKR